MPNATVKQITVPSGNSTVTVEIHDARITAIDTTPTQNSPNPITSGAVYTALGDINTVLESVL